jgi:hypothetical protein
MHVLKPYPSTITSAFTNSAPAALMSGSRAGYAAVRLPFKHTCCSQCQAGMAELGYGLLLLKETRNRTAGACRRR